MTKSTWQVKPYKVIKIRLFVLAKGVDREGKARDNMDSVEEIWI